MELKQTDPLKFGTGCTNGPDSNGTCCNLRLPSFTSYDYTKEV